MRHWGSAPLGICAAGDLRPWGSAPKSCTGGGLRQAVALPPPQHHLANQRCAKTPAASRRPPPVLRSLTHGTAVKSCRSEFDAGEGVCSLPFEALRDRAKLREPFKPRPTRLGLAGILDRRLASLYAVRRRRAHGLKRPKAKARLSCLSPHRRLGKTCCTGQHQKKSVSGQGESTRDPWGETLGATCWPVTIRRLPQRGF